MDGLGNRLRERARELGLTDAEVARRVALAPARYANYVHGRHDPPLGTFKRICEVLGLSADHLLGLTGSEPNPPGDRIVSVMRALDADALRTLAIVADGLVARSGKAAVRNSPADAPRSGDRTPTEPGRSKSTRRSVRRPASDT